MPRRGGGGGGMLGQTITVVNKSGKVVSTSKHLVNVFKEAKSAYIERKAEIKATREDGLDRKLTKQALDGDSRAHSVTDSPPSPRSVHSRLSSEAPSRHSSHHQGHRPRRDHRSDHHHDHRPSGMERRGSYKPPVERGYTDSFFVNDRPRQRSTVDRTSPLKFMEEAEREVKGKEMVRRRSLSDIQSHQTKHNKDKPQRSSTNIDMDLAYGELPPPLPARSNEESQELKVKVTALQRMLEEANCIQYSASAIIKSLENNPDAMAAVALTMAEISNIAAKLGPGALTALKGSFPAVVALLASPEFLIAAGVGVGITVIALGGYKIVKRIKAKKEMDKEEGSTIDELEQLESDVDVNSIEHWRRGIAAVEAESVGTSVEGEFITPAAAKALREEGRLPERKKTKKSSKDKKKAEKEKGERSSLEKEAKRAREKKEKQDKRDEKKEKEKEKKDRKRTMTATEDNKKSSGLSLMFKNRKDDGYDKDLII